MPRIFTDTVVAGRGLGKKLGYPTANLSKSHGIPSGVYGATIDLGDSRYNGLLVIGAFHRSDGLPAEELYILDFNEDIYGATLEIEIGEKIRDIRKFEKESDLKDQIEHDIKLLRKKIKARDSQ
jgi:riboflavin kinase/FMN adenylyltransferase